MKLNSISIFCASSPGFEEIWVQEAMKVGKYFAENNITLVYGGGRVGLMGAVADGCLAYQGKVIGVIPHFLNSKEIGHNGVTELIEVENMHQRKLMMNDLCEGVIAMPGGFGTMEELFEMITWAQLGLHQKPVGILNTNGFYNHLIKFMDHMVEVGVLNIPNRNMLLVGDTIEDLVQQMEAYQAPDVPKWLNKENI